MRILLAGGGSGGHVTPLRAIARSLQQKIGKDAEVTVISDRIFFEQTQFLFKESPEVALKKIYSGKFRRYNNKSFIWHIVHVPTLLKNIRDIALIGIGVVQSVNYFIWHKPDVVFCKGGYVCVPIGIAAHLFKVPLIIHDSDTHPGLTNRFLSRWASKIGTGMPTKYYNYPQNKMVYSGIPVDEKIVPFEKSVQIAAKKSLGLSTDKPVLFVTGGGTGAAELNKAVISVSEELLKSGWQIVHLTGKNKSVKVLKKRDQLSEELQKSWLVEEFAEVIPFIQAADIVVTRAGATAMQEFANAKKTVIIIPSPYLTGGHQLKNAAMFEENNAVIVIQESDLAQNQHILVDQIEALKNNPNKALELAISLQTNFAKLHASDELAQLILNAAASS